MILLNVMRQFNMQGQKLIRCALKSNSENLYDILLLSENLSKEVIDKNKKADKILSEGLAQYMDSLIKYIDKNKYFELINKIQSSALRERGMNIIDEFTEVLLSKQDRLSNFALKDLKDRKLAKQIKSFVKTGDSNKDALFTSNIYLKIFKHFDASKASHIWINPAKNKKFEYLKEGYQQLLEQGDKILKFHKIVLNKSQNSDVLAIENTLKNKYNLDYIHLETIEHARNIEKALEIAKQKNIPIPNNIIVTPYNLGPNINGLSRFSSDLKSSVYFVKTQENSEAFRHLITNVPDSFEKNILQAEYKYNELNNLSTSHTLHLYLHEFLHTANPLLLCNKTLPKSSKHNIAADYSNNCFNQFNEEIRVELGIKQVLEGLNTEEKKILDLLG